MSENSVRCVRFNTQEPVVIRAKDGVLKRYTLVAESNLGRLPKFSAGVSVLSKDCVSTLSGSKEEFSRERACIVASGKMRAEWNNNTKYLGQSDCLYIPPCAEYKIANEGEQELRCAWTMSHSFDEDALTDSKGNSTSEVKVIRTLQDVKPIVLSVPGMERSVYSISETKSFHFALFLRGPNTYSPLHTHVPENFEEAFIVLDGSLKVSGVGGESFILGESDCAYVPPFGGNMNENVSDKAVRYLWMGAPPVNVKEIPVEKRHSKLEKALAVDKE